jgi:hypothetical protein
MRIPIRITDPGLLDLLDFRGSPNGMRGRRRAGAVLREIKWRIVDAVVKAQAEILLYGTSKIDVNTIIPAGILQELR